MSAGIRALINSAGEEPLAFHIEMYCGQMVVSGRVAPARWWYEVTKAAYRAELDEALRKTFRKDHERAGAVQQHYMPFAEEMDRAAFAEEDAAAGADEVTLIDAQIFPAVSSQGTQSGGRSLPVARIPLAAIDAWWIVSGDTIRGRGGSNIGWGFLFPMGN